MTSQTNKRSDQPLQIRSNLQRKLEKKNKKKGVGPKYDPEKDSDQAAAFFLSLSAAELASCAAPCQLHSDSPGRADSASGLLNRVRSASPADSAGWVALAGSLYATEPRRVSPHLLISEPPAAKPPWTPPPTRSAPLPSHRGHIMSASSVAGIERPPSHGRIALAPSAGAGDCYIAFNNTRGLSSCFNHSSGRASASSTACRRRCESPAHLVHGHGSDQPPLPPGRTGRTSPTHLGSPPPVIARLAAGRAGHSAASFLCRTLLK